MTSFRARMCLLRFRKQNSTFRPHFICLKDAIFLQFLTGLRKLNSFRLVLGHVLKETVLFASLPIYICLKSISYKHGADYIKRFAFVSVFVMRILTVAFLDQFSPKLAQTEKLPKGNNEFVRGQRALSVCITWLISKSLTQNY